MLPNTEEEEWRAEFEQDGEGMIRAVIMGLPGSYFQEPKRQFAFKWLREKEKARERREDQIQSYVRWTLYAAVAAVVVGVIGVLTARYWH
jgi:hypothetical protein